jgi:hypothetical protein
MSGHSTGMKLSEVLQRIERRLTVLKISADKASAQAGKPDAIRNIRRAVKEGRAGVNATTVTALAPVLGTTSAWLLDAEGPETIQQDHIESSDILPDPDDSKKTVRIAGYVGASGEAVFYRFSDDQFEYVEPPPGATDQTVAVEVRGGSLGDAFKSWLVFYRDIRSPITEDLLNGPLCVVGLADDRILVKIIKRERDGSHTLVSNANIEPPIPNAAIEWASKVTDMRPR